MDRKLLTTTHTRVKLNSLYPFLSGFLYSTLLPATGALILIRTVWLWLYATATLDVARVRALPDPVRQREVA